MKYWSLHDALAYNVTRLGNWGCKELADQALEFLEEVGETLRQVR